MTDLLVEVEEFLRATTPQRCWRTTGYLPDGVVQASFQPLLACTADTLRSPRPVAGLSIIEVDGFADLAALRENIDLNARGFDPAAPPVSDEEAGAFGRGMGAAMAFTARLSGQGAGAGMHLAPHASVTELVGIATLEPMRGRGIGAALTATITKHAFDRGVTVAFLITGNPTAQRVYERVGFRVIGSVREGTTLF
jgi:GNAT superfamily N-acetyltransferase